MCGCVGVWVFSLCTIILMEEARKFNQSKSYSPTEMLAQCKIDNTHDDLVATECFVVINSIMQRRDVKGKDHGYKLHSVLN